MLVRLVQICALAVRCEPANYLRSGSWREQPDGQQLFDVPARCISPAPGTGVTNAMVAMSRRYACNNTAHGAARPRKTWEPALPCTRRPWSELFSSNRTVWIVGDSTSMQTAWMMHCVVSSSSAPESVAEPWDSPKWLHRLAVSGRDMRNHRVPLCARVGLGRLCFLPAGTDGGLTVARALELAIEHGNARADDVALVNSGVWQMGNAGGDAYQRRIVVDMLRLAARADCPRLFWRESYAQHFPTRDGVWPGHAIRTSARKQVDCTGQPLEQPRILKEVAAKLGAQPSITVLPTWHLSQHLPAVHHVGAWESANLDCTHYCNWSGLHEATLDAFAWAVYPYSPGHSLAKNHSSSIGRLR